MAPKLQSPSTVCRGTTPSTSVPRCCGLQRKPDQHRRQLALGAELILSHTGLALQAAMLPAANALRVTLSRARARAGVCDGVL